MHYGWYAIRIKHHVCQHHHCGEKKFNPFSPMKEYFIKYKFGMKQDDIA